MAMPNPTINLSQTTVRGTIDSNSKPSIADTGSKTKCFGFINYCGGAWKAISRTSINVIISVIIYSSWLIRWWLHVIDVSTICDVNPNAHIMLCFLFSLASVVISLPAKSAYFSPNRGWKLAERKSSAAKNTFRWDSIASNICWCVKCFWNKIDINSPLNIHPKLYWINYVIDYRDRKKNRTQTHTHSLIRRSLFW